MFVIIQAFYKMLHPTEVWQRKSVLNVLETPQGEAHLH